MANRMAIPHGAMEAARDLGLDSMAPGLTPLPHLQQAFLPPSTLGSPAPSRLHAPIYKTATMMPSHMVEPCFLLRSPL